MITWPTPPPPNRGNKIFLISLRRMPSFSQTPSEITRRRKNADRTGVRGRGMNIERMALTWLCQFCDCLMWTPADKCTGDAALPLVIPDKFWLDSTCKTWWENSPGMPGNKQQIKIGGSRPSAQLQPKFTSNHISFLQFTMFPKCSEGVYFT